MHHPIIIIHYLFIKNRELLRYNSDEAVFFVCRHGNREVFSCKGIKYAVDYFKQRGHQKIVVFVPLWRKESPRKDAPITGK